MNLRSLCAALLLVPAVAAAAAPGRNFTVDDFGAVGDGKTLCTVAIQKAVDACAAGGWGTVRLPAGRYLSGALVLKSNVTLRVERGATLLGSPRPEDYPEDPHAYASRFSDEHGRCSLITAEKAENVCIEGGGIIDGQGWGAEMKALIRSIKDGKTKRGMRPLVLRFSECRHVRVRDVMLRRSAFWMQNYQACEDVMIEGITVENVGPTNTDGLDLDGCKDVRVANCRIVSRDDALCLKSTSKRPCENVVVMNCLLSSRCNAIKCGTDSTGGFLNLAVSNCAVFDTGGAISLELVDGGVLDGVVVSRIVMSNVANPIFVRLGNRGRGQEKPTPGVLRNVILRDIQATEVTNATGCSITGLPEAKVENVTLENIRIRFKGGGKREDVTRVVPEWPERYPEFFMFTPEGVEMFGNREAGRLPAYGFWMRHARSVRLAHVDLDFEEPDERPAVVCDDVEDVKLFDVAAASTRQTPAVVWLRQADGALLSGCQARGPAATWLRVEGGSRRVALAGNDLRGVARPVDRSADSAEVLWEKGQ